MDIVDRMHNETSATDKAKIMAIAKRAVKAYAKSGVKIDVRATEMDLMATHLVTPLDLDKLSSFDDFNMAHDINGIARHLNRGTGELGTILCRAASCAKRRPYDPIRSQSSNR